MRMRDIAVLLLLGFAAAGLLRAKDKKPSVPEVFGRAHTAHVEAVDGQQFDRGLDPDEREAIADVQDALQAWKRYRLVTQREDADIVFVVRKGGVMARDGTGDQTNPNQIPTSGRPGMGGGPMGGARDPGPVAWPGSTGPGGGLVTEDLLEVRLVNADGKLTSPVWARAHEEGLNGPQVMLFKLLRDEVDKAYPNPPASQPAPQPQQPENPRP
jgi:hypothetical protein